MKINNPPGRNWLPPRRAFLLAVLARTTVPFPGVPANLKLHKLDSHSAQFRWSGAANAPINLYRATQSGGPYTLVDPVNQPNYIGTTAIDCELDPETSYWYVVSGVNERGESATSAEVAVNTPNRAEDMIQNAGFWAPDNTSEVIQAHAGFIAKFGDTYYWYGEDKRHNSARLRAVSIYVSQDLVHWEFRNNALTPDSDPELSEDNPVGAKIERPKVLYNDATGMYVLWGHKEPRANYNEARVCASRSVLLRMASLATWAASSWTQTRTVSVTSLAISPFSRMKMAPATSSPVPGAIGTWRSIDLRRTTWTWRSGFSRSTRGFAAKHRPS